MCVAKSDVRFTPNSDRESEFPQKAMSALPPKADMCGATTDVRFGPIADISDKPKIDGFHEHVENTTPDYDRSSCYHESGIKVRSLRGFCSQLRLCLIKALRGKTNQLNAWPSSLQRLYSRHVISQSNSYAAIHRFRPAQTANCRRRASHERGVCHAGFKMGFRQHNR